MQPKSTQRLINLRKFNKRMPRKRLDVAAEHIHFSKPDVLSQFTTSTGKILARKTTGVSAKLHRRVTREIKRARALNIIP